MQYNSELKKCRRRFCEEPECGINEVAVWTPEQCCKKCVTAVCTDEPPSCSYNINILYIIYIIGIYYLIDDIIY